MLFEPYVNMFSMKVKQVYIKRQMSCVILYMHLINKLSTQWKGHFLLFFLPVSPHFDIVLIISCHSTSPSNGLLEDVE